MTTPTTEQKCAQCGHELGEHIDGGYCERVMRFDDEGEGEAPAPCECDCSAFVPPEAVPDQTPREPLKFVRFRLRCTGCFVEQSFWGNADGGDTVATSFLHQHVNCGHAFNLPNATTFVEAEEKKND